MENQPEPTPVDQTPVEQPIQVPQQEEPKTKSNSFKLVIAVLLIIVLAVVGFAFYNKILTPTPKSTNVTTIPTTSTDPTANWKTYTNDKFGFSLKYPNGWDKLEADNENYARFFNGVYSPNLPLTETYISILSKENLSNKTVREWLIAENILPYPNDISTHIGDQAVTIGGITGIKITTPVNGGEETLYIPVGNQILQITYIFKGGGGLDDYNDLVQTFNQILSTFKFNDQEESIDTNDIDKLDYTTTPPTDWESNNLCGVSHKRSPQMPYSGRDAYTTPYNYECDFGYNFDELVGTIIPQILTVKVFSNYDGGSRRQFFAKYYDYSKNRTLLETTEFTAGNNSWLKLKLKDTYFEDDKINDATIYLTAKGSILVAVIGENEYGLTEINGTLEPVKMFLTSINF